MFLLSQNDENQSENGSKNSKIRFRARPPAEPQKKMLQTKKLRSTSWKTRFFFTFRLPVLDGRLHEQVSSVLFFTVFFEGERHDLSKTGGFGRKMPPPPGKPVTFYECHPDDHAPAPSVRADLWTLMKFDKHLLNIDEIWWIFMNIAEIWWTFDEHGWNWMKIYEHWWNLINIWWTLMTFDEHEWTLMKFDKHWMNLEI